VEICVEGFWGTVCTNTHIGSSGQQELAVVACRQKGFTTRGDGYHTYSLLIHIITSCITFVVQELHHWLKLTLEKAVVQFLASSLALAESHTLESAMWVVLGQKSTVTMGRMLL